MHGPAEALESKLSSASADMAALESGLSSVSTDVAALETELQPFVAEFGRG